jgi:hypothetical protein
MRVALKIAMIVWAAAVIISFGGLVYLFPSYHLDSAFSQALHGRGDPNLQYWFHWLELFFVIGLAMTAWLWRTYRDQYGRFWSGRAERPSPPR